jgi:hypothetical protein
MAADTFSLDGMETRLVCDDVPLFGDEGGMLLDRPDSDPALEAVEGDCTVFNMM